MKKVTIYLAEKQIEDLKLLSAVLPGQPDSSGLIRESITKYLEELFQQELVRHALAKKQKKAIGMRRMRPVG